MRPDLSRNSDPELLGAAMAGAKMRAFDFALDVLDIDPRKLHAWLAMTRSGDQPRSRECPRIVQSRRSRRWHRGWNCWRDVLEVLARRMANLVCGGRDYHVARREQTARANERTSQRERSSETLSSVRQARRPPPTAAQSRSSRDRRMRCSIRRLAQLCHPNAAQGT